MHTNMTGHSTDRPKKPVHRPNGPYYPIGLMAGEYCVFDREPWPCPTAQAFPDLQKEHSED